MSSSVTRLLGTRKTVIQNVAQRTLLFAEDVKKVTTALVQLLREFLSAVHSCSNSATFEHSECHYFSQRAALGYTRLHVPFSSVFLEIPMSFQHKTRWQA